MLSLLLLLIATKLGTPLLLPYGETIRTGYPNLLDCELYRFVLVKLFIPLIILFETFMFRCKYVTIMGTMYRAEKCWLMIGTTDISFGTVPQFGLLYDIIVQGSEANIYFVFLAMDTLDYDPILGAYKVKQLQEYRVFHRSVVSRGCYHPLNAVNYGGNLYIKSKYDLTVYCNY